MNAKNANDEPESEWGGIPTIGSIPSVGAVTEARAIFAEDVLIAEPTEIAEPDDRAIALLEAILSQMRQSNVALAHMEEAFQLSAATIKAMSAHMEEVLNRAAAAPPPMPVAQLPRPASPWPAPAVPPVGQFPTPQQVAPQATAADPLTWVCPLHGTPAKYVPAGIARSGPRAGQPYQAFYACSTHGCRERVR